MKPALLTTFLLLLATFLWAQPCDVFPLAISNYICDDNGTPGDPSDDTFSFEVTMGGVGIGTNYNFNNLYISGSGAYNTPVLIGPFNVSDAPMPLGFSDQSNPNCTYLLQLDPGVNCSNDLCAVVSTLSNYVCDNNGNTDPTDDTFTVDLDVTGFNASTGWSSSGFVNTTGPYGVTVTLGPFTVYTATTGMQIFDQVDGGCYDFVTIFSPGFCDTDDVCDISDVVISDITCFTNGTDTPDDDVYTFQANVTGTNLGSGWTANDPFNNFGSYNTLDQFGPFLISDGPLTITFTDNDNPGCTFDVTITPPLPCSTPSCDINATTSNILCDDNGTPNDPSDDTFTIDVLVTGSGTGSNWVANDVNNSTGNYNQLTTLGPYLISNGNLNFTISDIDDPTCTTTISVSAPPSCSVPVCSIDATSFNVQCDNNGTPNDPSDDTFTVDVLVTGTATGTNWLANDINNSSGNYNQVTTFGPYLISNGNLNFTISDIDDPTCTTTISVGAPPPCSVPVCAINVVTSNIQCDDNGTPNDPTDDTFTVDVSVAGTATGTNWVANDVNNSAGNYDQITTLGPYLILNGSLNFTISDIDDPTCTATISVGAPPPCSIPECAIDAVTSNIQCDDNGTPNDPTDDTFTVDVLVTGTATGSNWLANDANSSAGNYNQLTTLGPYLILNGNLNFTISDIDDTTCTATISVGAPPPCSIPECAIDAVTSNIQCDDNGTPSDPDDDTFTFEVVVTGSNTGNGWTSGSISGNYDQPTTFGPLLIGDGPVTLTFADNDDANCTTEVTIDPPMTCSGTCSITASTSNVVCDDNGTPSDPDDDTFTFEATVTGSNTGNGWTSSGTSGNYDETTSFGPFLISDGPVTRTFTDNDDVNCTTEVTIDPPMTCSGTCSITASTSNVICDDNGTPSDPDDDTFTFEVVATGSNTGNGWTSDNTSGNYDETTTFGPFLISDGPVTLTFTDNDDVNCTTEVTVDPPMTCSGTCSITASTSNVVCDDNGTPSDPDDDTFTFEAIVTGSNAGSGWTSGGTSGNYDETITFGPVLISDGPVSLTIVDAAAVNCTTAIDVTPPSACSNCTQTVNLSADGTLSCTNVEVVLLANLSAPITSSTWMGPDSFSIPDAEEVTITEPGVYYFEAVFFDGCIARDSITVFADNTIPSANGGVDTLLTCEIEEILLAGELGPNQSGQWLSENNAILSDTENLLVTTPGSYFYQVIDNSNGCTSALDEVIVLDGANVPNAVIFAAPADYLDCVITSISLSGEPQDDVLYTWDIDGEIITGISIIIAQAGTYELTVLDTLSGCVDTDQITITNFEEYPLINIEPVPVITCANTTSLIDATGSQTGSNIEYQWFDENFLPIPDSMGNTLTVDAGGTYYLQLTDTENGCENIDTILVPTNFTFPSFTLAELEELPCLETETQLSLELDGDPNEVTIQWSSASGNILAGGTTTMPEVEGLGYYQVSVQNISNGCISLDSILVSNNQNIPNALQLNVMDETCLGLADGSAQITGIEGGNAPYIYTLNATESNSVGIFNNLEPGIYDLNITDVAGCTLDTSFIIDAGIDLQLELPPFLELREGGVGLVQGITNVPESDLSLIQWTPGENLTCDSCLITRIIAQQNEDYLLTIVHNNGCVVSASLQLLVKPDADVYIPNAFSPNDDGVNDFFTVFTNDQIDQVDELLIFDRWGEIVFQQDDFAPNDPSLGWDGRFRGKPLNAAVFVYVFKLRTQNGEQVIYSGDVTVNR